MFATVVISTCKHLWREKLKILNKYIAAGITATFHPKFNKKTPSKYNPCMTVDCIYSNTIFQDKNKRISNVFFLEVKSSGDAVIKIYLLTGIDLVKQWYLMTSENN